jgi:hypothetical protein
MHFLQEVFAAGDDGLQLVNGTYHWHTDLLKDPSSMDFCRKITEIHASSGTLTVTLRSAGS